MKCLIDRCCSNLSKTYAFGASNRRITGSLLHLNKIIKTFIEPIHVLE